MVDCHPGSCCDAKKRDVVYKFDSTGDEFQAIGISGFLFAVGW